MRGYPLSDAVRGFVSYCALERENTPTWLRFQERTLWEFLFSVEDRADCLEALQPFHLTDYLQTRQAKGDTAATRHRRAVIIRAMCRWAEDQGRVQACPLARVKMPRTKWLQREIPPFPVIQALVRGEADPDLRDAMELLLYTGLRRGELLAAIWSGFDLDRGLHHVRATTAYAPKSRRPRAVPLCGEAVEILRRRRGLCKVGPFLGAAGPVLSPERLTKGFKALATRAHLAELRLHDLRHAFATHALLDLKADVLTVKEVLGHSDLSVTRRYVHARTDSADALRALWDGAQEHRGPLTGAPARQQAGG